MSLLAFFAATATLEATFCAGQTEPCRIVESRDAGTNGEGIRLRIHEVLIDNPVEAQEDYFACRPGARAFWLEWVDTQKPPVLLMQLCNDGYGASGVGEDTITVNSNEMIWGQMGGSAWRWDMTYALQLDPFRVRSERSCGWHALSPEWSARQWNWESFAGSGAHHNMTCTPDGAPLETDFQIGDCSEVSDAGSYVLVPKLAAFPEGEFALGSCSALIDSAGINGYVVHGSAGDASDASMRVVQAGDGSFVIEVTDDHFVDAASSWVKADHLQFWMSGGGSGVCGNLDPPPLQFAILRDGSILQANGASVPLPEVTATNRDGIWQVRLTLSGPPGYFTFVYSDSDDAKSQERLIATSTFRYGKAETMGDAYYVDAAGGACEIRDGRLEATGLPDAARVVPSVSVR